MPGNLSIDGKEIAVRILKYLLEGTVVGIAALLVPKKKISVEEILTIALAAAAAFSILDLSAPAIAHSARSGAGLSVGAGLVGGVPLAR